jgi:Spy/CpxP family protein refolding chaperone
MKKTLFITLVILAAFSISAFAGCRPGFGPGCGGPGGCTAMFDKELKDLNLTPAQQAQLDAIKKDIDNDMKAHHERMQAMHKDAIAQLSKDNPDINAIASGIKQQLAADTNPGIKMVDHFTKFYNTLDVKQQKQLIEKIKVLSKKCPGMNGPGCHGKTDKCPQTRKGCPMAG